MWREERLFNVGVLQEVVYAFEVLFLIRWKNIPVPVKIVMHC